MDDDDDECLISASEDEDVEVHHRNHLSRSQFGTLFQHHELMNPYPLPVAAIVAVKLIYS